MGTADEGVELDVATRRALSHRLAVAQHESRLPSVAAGVVRRGRLVWADARGTVVLAAR